MKIGTHSKYVYALATSLAIAPLNCFAQGTAVDISATPTGQSQQLRVWLVLTKDEAKVRNDWADPSQTPRIQNETAAKPGDNMTSVVVFENCKPNTAGQCDITAEFALLTADGKRIEAGSGSLWSSKPMTGRLMLGAVSVTVAVANDWSPGRYALAAKVTDHVLGGTLDLLAPFTVPK